MPRWYWDPLSSSTSLHAQDLPFQHKTLSHCLSGNIQIYSDPTSQSSVLLQHLARQKECLQLESRSAVQLQVGV